jgi:hypothetical protein
MPAPPEELMTLVSREEIGLAQRAGDRCRHGSKMATARVQALLHGSHLPE